MAKRKAAKAPSVRISGHLKKPLESVLKEARALKGKVTEASELDALIRSLETLKASAESNCPRTSWQRAFTAKSTATLKKKR
jgi:hypothetical protein